jgi:hypothetical protein
MWLLLYYAASTLRTFSGSFTGWGLINQDEAAILTRAEHSRLRSINVDDFAPEELASGAKSSTLMLRKRLCSARVRMAASS